MSGVDHLGFIVAAYAVTALVLGATLAVLFIDSRTQKTLLARLDPGEKERR
jgi:heme exporter protein CcmD